jgi:RsiW-degrading membrane proteinase PrsW (M82 family)
MLALRVLLGATPSVLLLIYFYLRDRYEPEPRGHVAAAFAKGMASSVPAFFAQAGLERLVGRTWLVLGGWEARAFEAVVMAGGVEELAKWLIFVLLIYRWQELDEPMDGIVYGVALALGFATVENVLCVVRDGLAIGLLRAVFAVPAHALFGAVMGFWLGRAKLGLGRNQQGPIAPRDRRRRIALSLVTPLACHAAYDFFLVELRGAWLYASVALLSLALWAFVLRRVSHAQLDSPFREAEAEAKDQSAVD